MPQITKTTVGSFCKELVLQLSPLDSLLKDWELDVEQYEALCKSEFFQKELAVTLEEVRSMGPDAGFITRCKILTEDALPELVQLLHQNTTPPEVKVSIFDKLSDLARLKPSKSSPVDNTPRGPLVTFNFGAGMPGLPTSIDVTPKRVEE